MKAKIKYSANRCNRVMGEDMENQCFRTKKEALRWVKRVAYGKIRDVSKADRPVIHEHSNFSWPAL